jgi:L-cystine uptake protein TcyP (sodium:dicarboxylate symporter family)
MSTFTRAYASLAVSVCLLSCGECKELNKRLYCNTSLPASYVLQIIPNLLRAIHSINVVYYKKSVWPHLGNAFRFLVSSITITLNFLYSGGII